jgi:predicted nucleotidyltransferase
MSVVLWEGKMKGQKEIIRTVLDHYPDAQAIYLFGSYGTEQEWPGSDVDIAVLLPPEEAKKSGLLMMSDLRPALESLLEKEVDLINLRRVPTVLQKEVVTADCRIYEGDRYAAEEFEMLTLSYYQKLNEERAEIIKSALSSERFHQL